MIKVSNFLIGLLKLLVANMELDVQENGVFSANQTCLGISVRLQFQVICNGLMIVSFWEFCAGTFAA